MQNFKRVYFLLSAIPLVWFIAVLTSFFTGAIILGHIPSEGWDDPGKIGIDWFTPIILFGILIVYMAIISWLMLTVGLLFSKESRNLISKKAILIFGVGVIGFLVARNSFDGRLLWILD
ncbi:hypothetical protein [Pollutibacter soli]|uniref:hypothetical protein n=1 Tax=Pollutibacter soli TaxID=3034157 RepID=UPI003013A7F4